MRIHKGVALCAVALFSFAQAQEAPPDPLLRAMSQELNRAKTELAKADPAPYYLSYTVTVQHTTTIMAANGALYVSAGRNVRNADVSMRVGSAKLDNTHGEGRASGLTSGELPLEDDQAALARSLWQLTDREYKKSSEAFLRAKTNAEVRAQDDDKSSDFSAETQYKKIEDSGKPLTVDEDALADRMRKISAQFRQYPQVLNSAVTLQVEDTDHYFVSSEGSLVKRPERVMRLALQAQGVADDGMELLRVETFLAPSIDKLPTDAELTSKIATMAGDLSKLLQAKLAEPYDGPALLSGRAAAVFFHEVLGHRLEGQRQKGDNEGQTFARKVNQQVLPDFLSVIDDPTERQLNGADLAGWYDADDEGEPAQAVHLIENGTLKNFLMSRMPVNGFDKSNGHGRAEMGYLATGRQGNLIVESSRKLPEGELRDKFMEEIKKQNKPYGLYFEDIEGGFTLTTRALPQAFQVLPVMVWRVYADGRPDELVRGVDIVGTPLAALNHILMTGDKQHVFNGICGAESGSIPVSAVAPAMLFSEIEVQRKQQGHERPPILPPPSLELPGTKTAAVTQ